MVEREIYDFEKEWMAQHPYRLSRAFESKLPSFSNHIEAWKYFKKRFGEDFVTSSSDIVNGERMYFYDLVVHRENYDKYKDTIFDPVEDSQEKDDFMLSYHSVQIWESGGVHIVF